MVMSVLEDNKVICGTPLTQQTGDTVEQVTYLNAVRSKSREECMGQDLDLVVCPQDSESWNSICSSGVD